MTISLFLSCSNLRWSATKITIDHYRNQLFGLAPVTLEKLESVFQKHDAIDVVIIYGSRAKGNYKTGSDIDLTIKGSMLSFSELMQIEDQIDDLYLPYSVDVSQYEQLKNNDLIEHIDHVGVVIYKKRECP